MISKFACRAAWLSCIAGCLLAASVSTAIAQEQYPTQPIKILVPTAAGGNGDALARVMAEKMSAAWGQPVLVENRIGANGIIATSALAKSAGDGYTLLFTYSNVVQNPSLYPNLPYRLADLAPVARVTFMPVGLAISTSVKANSLGEFLALAKANPPKTFSYGSYGIGSSAHIFGAMLNRASGTDVVHVPYKGEAPAITDLLAGRVAVAYGSVGGLAQHVKGGRIKMIAVANPQRVPAFPDVPTFLEAGFPAINAPGWGAMFAPASTPKAIVQKLSAEFVRILNLPDVSAKILSFGYTPGALGADEFAGFVKTEFERWEKAIKQNEIKVE